MGKDYSYRNLIVWQRAQSLAMEIIHLTQHVPQSWANAVIVRQIVSAVTSIGANIAEGHGRYMIGAHRNHLSIAKGSAAETDSWIDLLHRAGYISSEAEATFHRECVEIMAMLTSKIVALTQQEPGIASRVRESSEQYVISADSEEPPFPFLPADYLQ